ncbi:MAG TPA: tetratricopeptide repeat protein [Polyangia bacterium]|nr:tetratricopeptide repeat protein [Polyangia bacterium]
MLTKKDKHLAAAQKFLERGQDHRALEEFARVVQEDPADTRTWLRMAEIHVRHGALTEARDIYLRTAEIYTGQGFLPKAITVYKSVLKLTPGLPQVRVALGEAYRRLGMVADALQELELAVAELQQSPRPADALPALRKMVELHPENVVSRIRLAEAALQAGRTDEAVSELGQACDQLRLEGRADEFVRVAERLLFHRPDDHAVARDLAAAYVARKNPRLALAKLQRALKAAPRDPANVTLLAEAMAQLDPHRAISVWRELAEIHAEARREEARDAAVRAALALDPTDGETREMAARWGVSSGRGDPKRVPEPSRDGLRQAEPGAVHALGAAAARARLPPPKGPAGTISSVVTSVQVLAPEQAPADRAGPQAGALSGLSRPGLSGVTPMGDVPRILSEAEVFVKYGLAERAVDHLRKIFALEPEHREARERLAAVLAQTGRKREAAAELATLAAQLRAAGAAEAPKVAERALALDPACAKAAELLGRTAASPPPERTPGTDDLAMELEQLDFFAQQSLHDEARAVLVDLEQRFPGHPLLAERRRAYAVEGPGAIPGGEPPPAPAGPVAKLSPSESADPTTHGDLGIAYKQMGLFDAAIEEFKQLAADKSRAVFAYTMIGECVEAKGELGEAVKRYKEALNLPQATAQESVELYYLLGAVFEQLGDVREALYFFENVGKRDPGFRDVKKRIVALKTPSGVRS